MGRACNTCRAMHVYPHVLVVPPLCISRVHADPDLDRLVVQFGLDLAGRVYSVQCAQEDDEESIARAMHLLTASTSENFAHQLLCPNQLALAVTPRVLDQFGGPLDVREQERKGFRGKS